MWGGILIRAFGRSSAAMRPTIADAADAATAGVRSYGALLPSIGLPDRPCGQEAPEPLPSGAFFLTRPLYLGELAGRTLRSAVARQNIEPAG